MMILRGDLAQVCDDVSGKLVNFGAGGTASCFTQTVKQFHSDGTKEYKALKNDSGGGSEDDSFSPPYTPELNGIADRVNRAPIEAARSMLIQTSLLLLL